MHNNGSVAIGTNANGDMEEFFEDAASYYAGSFVYEESDLKKVLHSEGVVKVDCTPLFISIT